MVAWQTKNLSVSGQRSTRLWRTETERRVYEETHRMEQRDPATGLRQGLHRQRSQV